jgi:hypothetical protein
MTGKAYFVRGLQTPESPDAGRREFEGGATAAALTESFCRRLPERTWDTPVICLVDGEPLMRADWHRPVKAGAEVIFAELPLGGGGSNPLQLLVALVIMAAAIVVPYLAVTAMGLTGVTASLVTGLIAGVITMAGSFLMGAIFKPPGGSLPMGHIGSSAAEQASPTYGLNASNNQARLYQPIGEGFGRIRIVPDRVAQAWAEYIDNEMYLYQVFGLGRGSYQVESMYFGDTAFYGAGAESPYDVEVAFYEPGQAVGLFPDNVETSLEVSGQQLFHTGSEDFGTVGPFASNPPGTSTSRIICNVIFPQGIGVYDDFGDFKETTVSIKAEACPIDDDGNETGSWGVLFERDFTESTMTAQRHTLEAETGGGRYLVRMERTDGQDTDKRFVDACQWESMSAFMPGSVAYNQSTVALKTRATNVLSQSAASKFSVTYTRLLPVYSPVSKSWSAPQPTRSLAAAVSHVLHSEQGGGLPYDRIDLDALWGTIDPVLAAKGWTFDGYFDGAYKVLPLVLEMCQAFRVVPRIAGGGMSFVYDRPNRPVRHVFTPRDIVRGSLAITYHTFTDDTPDNIIWQYLDEDAGYQQREVQITLPGSETRNPVVKSFIGCVKRAQAFQMGAFAAGCNRHRRISVKFGVEAAGRLILMGDVCSLTHPHYHHLRSGAVLDADPGGLRVRLWEEGEADQTPAAPGGNYLTLDGPDGTPWGPCLVSVSADGWAAFNASDYAQSGSPFGWIRPHGDGSSGTAWTLQAGKEFTERIIVQSVVPTDMYHYEITAMNDAAEVEAYEGLPVPPWDYRGQIETPGYVVPAAPQISGITASVSGGNVALNITWLPVQGASGYVVEVMYPGSGYFARLGSYYVNSCTVVTPPGVVQVRVKASGYYGGEGPYGTVSVNTASYLEPAVPFTVVGNSGGQTKIRWSNPAAVDSSGGSVVQKQFVKYTLTVRRAGSGGGNVYAVSASPAGGAAHEWTFTREMGLAAGGPWRETEMTLVLTLYRQTVGGWGGPAAGMTDSVPYTATVSDPAPTLTGTPQFTVAADRITLTSAPYSGEGTGWIMIRGTSAGFGVSGAVEQRQTASLPFAWTGLSPDTRYYFRIAPKDSFADMTGNWLDLNYTDALAADTPEA